MLTTMMITMMDNNNKDDDYNNDKPKDIIHLYLVLCPSTIFFVAELEQGRRKKRLLQYFKLCTNKQTNK
jgi:hypothetical protein